MSVDDRIREGLTMTEQHLRTPDADVAFESVTRTADRQTMTRRLVVAGSVAAAAAAVAAAVALSSGDPTSTPAPADPPTTAPTVQAEAPASPIEGEWRSEPVTFADLATTLRESGLASEVPALRTALGDVGRARLTLVMVDGDEVIRIGGQEVGTATYTLGTGTVSLTSSDWSDDTVLEERMTEGPSLAFTLVGAPRGATDGLSDEALVRALYTTTSFTQVGEQ